MEYDVKLLLLWNFSEMWPSGQYVRMAHCKPLGYEYRPSRVREMVTTNATFQASKCQFNLRNKKASNFHVVYIYIYLFIYLFTAIGLLPGGSGYFTCKQKMKLVTTRFKSEGLHEKHVVATWNLGNHLSICL